MSVLNLRVTSGAAYLFTDGLGYRGDGAVTHLVQKTFTLAHLPAAIAVRGCLLVGPTLAEDANGRFATFDELVADFAPFVRRVADAMAPIVEKSDCREIEVGVVGWSRDRDRAEGYILHNHAGGGFEPWQVVPVAEGYVSPADAALCETLETLEPVEDCERAAVMAMEAQRARLWSRGASPIRAVGGFVQMTTVTRDGVESRVIHRWPDDRVGAPIAA